MRVHSLAAWAALLLFCGPVAAELLPTKVRAPQYPLKTQRMLLSDADIALAREQVARYETAKGIADTIVKRADAWLAWDDAALRALVPTADVPRAFNVGTAGCPQCGKAIYEKGGTYPWIIDPKKPFQVTCPVDGSTYPSNDYAAYYAGGLNDRTLLTGDYPDDGWGWAGPDGHRYWFVAYANHWTWRNHVIPAAHYLGRAYVLTGNRDYARKAAVLLDRIAEVYPNMDYHTQSRYGQMQAANGARYEGKIVNLIWETGVLTMMAEAYDYVWDAIDDTTVAGKTGEQVRANIEANLLEEGIDAYFSGKARGNFGMHQKALVYVGLARQYGKQDEWFEGLLNDAGDNYRMTGLNYALYNLVYRDGAPYETAPGYNFSWVVNLTTVAEALTRAGYDVYGIPKMRRLYDAVLDVVNVGKHTPSVGDSGSVYGGLVGLDPFVYQSAWRAYGDPRYRDHLQSFGAVGEAGIRRFESLFAPIVEAGEPASTPVRSRLLDGYGMAILNNPANTVSLALYYGYAGGHGHYDRLHFELFANDQVMMPDLGYPDFMNAYVPGIFSWSKNTIAHNTVTVNAQRQLVNKPGTVHLFADAGFARALDIDAAATYPETDTYRRRMMLIDLDGARSYAVDCFTVAGADSAQHDYSLHGPPGTFAAVDGEWSDPAPGTLAGPDVPVGYLYDEPEIAGADYTGSYANYRGSGFQHLEKVQRLTGGAAAGVWRHERDADARIRIDLLAPDAEILRAEAQVSPITHTQRLTYLIARRTGDALASRFVSVIEPHRESPAIQSRRLLPGDGVALEVRWALPGGESGRDLVLINTEGGVMRREAEGVETDAPMALVRFAGEGAPRYWMAAGSYLRIGDERIEQTPGIAGAVTRVEPESGRVHVALDGAAADLSVAGGGIVHFENAYRRAAHPVASVEATAEGAVITVADDLRVGRIRVAVAREDGLATATGLAFAPVYDGTYAAHEDFSAFVPLRAVKGGVALFAEPGDVAAGFVAGEDAWIVNAGPGDRVEVTPVRFR
ncbi:MAG: heparinase II/III family protein [Candidatus Hydrogenedentes bacterium]|nr:heparinase II/III family protein [Candidatus Hydrogenedentota bacterium]